MVVFLSLVGFISLAWLRDQLLHGGAPQWLARDQRALNQMRMREAHDSIDLLRIHLEQSSARARERAKEPDRYLYMYLLPSYLLCMCLYTYCKNMLARLLAFHVYRQNIVHLAK